ncbi:hypothetical protein MKQ70_34730 [Chitinophaga sedimenti]|nr:hypothetical protein [Chitinophaga sedimenti]
MIDVVKMPAFEKAWLQYCELYNASGEEQQAVLGRSLGKLNLRQGHARLTAFAANRKKIRSWQLAPGRSSGWRQAICAMRCPQ